MCFQKGQIIKFSVEANTVISIKSRPSRYDNSAM